MNCFQCFHFHNQGWPSLMLFDNMINVCNIGVRKLANDIYCSGMIYLSPHWKRQHFASAFNCFVGVRINIYKLAMVRKFYDNNEWIFKLELFLSLRQIWFSLHFISFQLLLCDFRSGFAQFITEMLIQLFRKLHTIQLYMHLPLESIELGRHLILSLCL